MSMKDAHAARPRLIVTADDFGLHEAVNDAVEQGCRNGVLRAASLMVAAPAAADAVARAKRLPELAVGLHLVLADGAPMLPPTQVPDLVGADGRFGSNMAKDGVKFFFLPHVRRQLEAEIRAQFEAFAGSGLVLDHVNAHKHFHLHPTVLSLILSIGRQHGLKAVRLPVEPSMPGWLKPWLNLMRWRLRRNGIAHNDHVFGISHSGGMDETTVLEIIDTLPAGVSEMYLHPAARNQLTPSMAEYRHTDELAALISPAVGARVAERCELLSGFGGLQAARA